MKLTGSSCAFNSLTNFEYEVHVITGNGMYVNLLTFARKKSWNHIKWTYFWRVLAIWNPCVPPRTATSLCSLQLLSTSQESVLRHRSSKQPILDPWSPLSFSFKSFELCKSTQGWAPGKQNLDWGCSVEAAAAARCRSSKSFSSLENTVVVVVWWWQQPQVASDIIRKTITLQK